MSIICFKELDNKIQVAADGRCISDGGGGLINDENLIKIHKISDKLIIGVTGIVDIIGVFKKFVIANKYVFETLDNVTDALPLFKRFNDYTSEYFGYDGDAINEFGGFLVANNVFHGVFYYGDYGQPYCVNDSFKTFAFGSTGIYTTALLDYGVDVEEAIKITAKKYTTINDNVTLLEIDK